MNDVALNPQTQKMLDYFESAQNNPAKRAAIINSPLEVMSNLGLEIKPEHQAAVLQSLRALALSFESQPVHTKTFTANNANILKADNVFEKHFHVSAELWGIVVRVDHEVIKQLPEGGEAIEEIAAAAGGVMAAATSLGPAGAMALLGLAYWGALLTAYAGLLPLIDQGNGVYLTFTWPQLVAVVASGGILGLALFPIPTAVLKHQ